MPYRRTMTLRRPLLGFLSALILLIQISLPSALAFGPRSLSTSVIASSSSLGARISTGNAGRCELVLAAARGCSHGYENGDAASPSNKNEATNNQCSSKRSELRGFLSYLSRRPRAALSALGGGGGSRRLRTLATAVAALSVGLDLINPRAAGAAASAAVGGGVKAVSLAKGTITTPSGAKGTALKDKSSSTKRNVIIVGAAAAVGTAYGRGVIRIGDGNDSKKEGGGGLSLKTTDAETNRKRFNQIMGTHVGSEGSKGAETGLERKSSDVEGEMMSTNAGGKAIEKDLKRQAYELNKELNKEAEEMREERMQMELKAVEKKMGLDSSKKGGEGFQKPSSPLTSDASGAMKAGPENKPVEIDESERQAKLKRVQEEEERQKKEQAFLKARAEEEEKIRQKAEKLEVERLQIERKAAEKAAEKERLKRERAIEAQKAEAARVAEAERALQRQREEEAARRAERKKKEAEEAARLAEQKKKEAEDIAKAEETKRIEAKMSEAEKKWTEQRMNKAEARPAVKQMNQRIEYVRKPSPKEEQELNAKYASMPLEERAFNILLDLGMISQSPDPSDPSYDNSQDDDIAPENVYKP